MNGNGDGMVREESEGKSDASFFPRLGMSVRNTMAAADLLITNSTDQISTTTTK